MLPPTIPTSFVPHTPSTGARRSYTDYTGVLGALAYLLLGIVFVLAIGVFLYGRMLTNTLATKDAALDEAVKGIDVVTVESFIRLRDRLSEGAKLLGGHVAFSVFFSSLEKILPVSVRFSSIHLSLDSNGAPKLEGTGVAKSFNALAAASTAFATDGRIKGAIFSNISINKDGSVSFVLSASLDQRIIAFSP